MEYFLGQIVPIAFNFAPKNTAFAQGQLLPIAQNQALFSLLGTTYGGNGSQTFALPDTRGRSIVGMGTNFGASYPIGMIGGATNVTLTVQQLPQHNHLVNVAGSGTSGTLPANAQPGTASATVYAAPGGQTVTLAQGTVAPAGGGQPHPNMQPSLAINHVIVMAGVFPSRN